MNIVIRQALESDLASILQLYAQPEIDMGEQLVAKAAEEIFDRIERYPNYHLLI